MVNGTTDTGRQRLNRVLTWIILALIVVLAIVAVLVLARYAQAARPLLPAAVARPFFLLLVGVMFVGIYPVAYLAYWLYIDPVQVERLKEDFRLLGLVREEELESTVRNLYYTTFNRVQYLAYILPIMLVGTLIFLGFVFREQLKGYIPPSTMTLIFFSFLGAFVFSVQELIRRYNTSDLRPQVYSSILVRILIAAAITFAAAGVIDASAQTIVINVDQSAATEGASGEAAPAGEEATAIEPAAGDTELAVTGDAAAMVRAEVAPDAAQPAVWAAVLAFVIGMFPSRGTRWLLTRTNTVLNDEGALNPGLPLRDLAGISVWHEARLLEMGIDDAHNLATVDLRKMLLTTRFDTQQIVNWVDQAILYARVRERLALFRAAGITTFHEYRMQAAALQDPSMKRQRETARTIFKLSSDEELDALANFENYPNYAHIAAFYDSAAGIASQRATVGFQRLYLATGYQDFAREADYYRKRLNRDKEDAETWANLGAALVGKNEPAEALKALTEALRLDDSLNDARTNRAGVYVNLQRADEAIGDCDVVIGRDPNNRAAYNYRGLARLLQAEANKGERRFVEQAIEDFSKALELDAGRFGEAYLNRGVAQILLERYEPALKDFEYAYLLLDRSKVKQWSKMLLKWGVALIGAGRYYEATAKLSEGLSLEPDAVSALADRGFAYMQLNQPVYDAYARRDLADAARLAGERGETATALKARTNLALLESRLGNVEAAYALYKQLAADAPAGSVEATAARDALDRLSRERYNHGVELETAGQKEAACAEYQWLLTNAPEGMPARELAEVRMQTLCV